MIVFFSCTWRRGRKGRRTFTLNTTEGQEDIGLAVEIFFLKIVFVWVFFL